MRPRQGRPGVLQQLSDALRRLSMKSTAASAAMTPVTQMLAAVALSAVISVALLQSADRRPPRSARFVAFVTAMLMLIAPIKHLSEVASPITRGLAALERGLDLMEHTPDEARRQLFQRPRAEGEIGFVNVARGLRRRRRDRRWTRST